MNSKFLKLILILLVHSLFVFVANSQELKTCSYIQDLERFEPLSEQAKERMMTLCIEENKKEFKKLIKNSEEVAKLSSEIETSFTENNRLSNDDQKKLKRVEKLLKKIQKELRANKDDEDENEDKPSSTLQAIKDLQTNTTKLLKEIKKTTRYTISTAAIQSSNVVMKIVKFLRFRK